MPERASGLAYSGDTGKLESLNVHGSTQSRQLDRALCLLKRYNAKHLKPQRLMEPLPFTIEDYQKLVVEAGTHEVKNGKNEPGRVICTDRPQEDYPVVALINGWEVCTFTAQGRYVNDKEPSDKDLYIVPKPPKSLGWMNVYSTHGSIIYDRKEDADQNAAIFRLACIEVFEGQGLTEP